ncbi:MAG: FAD-dependent oxidoreductase [Frankiaceae bacterium]|nr:FAD-dependent oxidoreductase [Frankiaceae bacterium]
MGTLDETNPSLWVETTRDEQPQTTDLVALGVVDVVVVGAGITGLSTALVLAERGARVAVLEAGRICSGVTAYTTAKVTSLHGLMYDGLRKHRGDGVAKAYADANQAAVEQVATWVDRYDIDCDFSRRPAYTYTTESERVGDVQAEVAAAQSLGLPVTFTTNTELPYAVAGAIRMDGQAQFHPRRYCLGLAAAFTGLGGQIVEHARVTGVSAGSPCEVQLDDSTVTADNVVLATHLPILDRGLFFAKTHPTRSYATAVRLKGDVPRGMYLSADSPTRSVRSAEGDTLVILGGEGHKVGQDPDTRERYAALEQWGAREWNVEEVVHRWSAQDYMSGDGIPYVGRQLPGSQVFVATGFGKWGMTNGTAAGGIIADLIGGTATNAWADAFHAARVIGPLTSMDTYRESIDAVGGHLIGDRLKTLNPPDADTLAAGEGGIVKLDGDKVAAYRHHDGSITAVSPVCRHVGCLVAFNTAEKTWDCPCHGSRYTLDGKVIQGPSVHDLEQKR